MTRDETPRRKVEKMRDVELPVLSKTRQHQTGPARLLQGFEMPLTRYARPPVTWHSGQRNLLRIQVAERDSVSGETKTEESVNA
jgi:hypothetical protein